MEKMKNLFFTYPCFYSIATAASLLYAYLFQYIYYGAFTLSRAYKNTFCARFKLNKYTTKEGKNEFGTRARKDIKGST